MTRQLVAAAVFTFVGLGTANFAAAQAQGGDKEIKVGGFMFATDSGGNTLTSANFNFGFGYFVASRFEISVVPSVSVSSNQTPVFNSRGIQTGTSTSISTDGSMALQGQFFLGAAASRSKPYFGATAVLQSFKTENGATYKDNLYTGFIFGVKNYFTERAAFDLNTQYGFQVSRPQDSKLLTLAVGITYLF